MYDIASLKQREQELEIVWGAAIKALGVAKAELIVARTARKAACFAQAVESGTLDESTPIPAHIQSRVVEILTERGFMKDGKIIRRPALPEWSETRLPPLPAVVCWSHL